MAKKSSYISSFPLLITIVIIATVLVGIGRGQPASTPANIDSARANIISLADAGKLAETDAAVNKLAADYTDTTVLTINYYIIADSFAWRRMYDRADRLYQLVINKSSDSSLVAKAQLGLKKTKILCFIGEKKYSAAQEAVDLMVVTFKSEPDLANALFQIGQEFSWQRRHIEAGETFDKGISLFPNSPASKEMKLWSARANVCELVMQRKDDEALAAIDKLIKDFEGDAGLPAAMYWISKEYEWTKGTVEIEDRTGWYNTPNSVYGKLMRQFGDTTYGWEAEWDQKRLSHRMKIFNLMKESNQAATDAAIEAMVADLKGRPEISGELRWIAWGYEEQPDKSSQAKQLFKRIIREYPGTVEANEAVLDIRRLDIWESLNSGDINEFQLLMNKFIADFKQIPYAGNCFGGLIQKTYDMAVKFDGLEEAEQAKRCFERAILIGERLTQQLPESEFASVGYYEMADCYYRLGDFNTAIFCHNKIVTEFPEYKNAYISAYMIAHCYDKLASSGKVSQEDARKQIGGMCRWLLARYPECAVAGSAKKLLRQWDAQ